MASTLYLKLGLKLADTVDLQRSLGLLAWLDKPQARVQQLLEVLVHRQDAHERPLLIGAQRNGPDDVVCLHPRLPHDDDPHAPQHRIDLHSISPGTRR